MPADSTNEPPTVPDPALPVDDVQALTPRERRVYYQHLLISVIENLTWGLSDACINAKLLRLANGNFAAISDMNSVHWGVNAAMQLLVSPIGGALTDCIGRKWLLAASNITHITYFLGGYFATNIWHYCLGSIMNNGIFGPISMHALPASWSDVFGSRPELSSRLKSRHVAYHAATGLVGPLIGAALAQANESWGFYASFAACILQFGCALMCEETLPKEQRKPFTGWAALLRRSNPLTNIRLLFRSGAGLRALSISSICWNAVGTIWSSMDSYRLGAPDPTLALLPSGLPEVLRLVAQGTSAGRRVSKAR